ncbi:RNase H domain-containing protein [Trichonephila clavipes]|nr:RNase H domain-containing protein [Trichonephila clavipes]
MNSKYLRRIQRRILLRVICGYRTISYDSVYAISGFPPIDIAILHDIAFRENLSASSISNYDCILSPFFIPHPSERNAINIDQIQKQLKSPRDKNTSTDFAFVRGHTGVLGNERADWLAKAATKSKIDIDVNIPKSFYKKITNEKMMKSWNQEYLISNKGSITKKFFPPLIRDYHVIIFTLTTN